MFRPLSLLSATFGRAGVALRDAATKGFLTSTLSRSLATHAAPIAIPAASLVAPNTRLLSPYNPSLVSRLHMHQYLKYTCRNPSVISGVSGLLTPPADPGLTQSRSVIKWSLQKGKRKSVKAVLKRFKRLDWGGRSMWIRPRTGANKKMWKKSPSQRLRLKTHVFCNATQCRLLDKMVTRYWKKTRHYPDDPYRPYLRRENFPLCRAKPREYF